MDREPFIAALIASLHAIRNPQFYTDERAFQGQLLVELSNRLLGVLPADGIVQQEAQKRLADHGLNQRPDIIVHEPFDPQRHEGRYQGNHAAIALKRRATASDAEDDFKKLQSMLDVLDYPLGVFINIDALTSFSNQLPNQLKERVVCFAVRLSNDGAAQVVTV